MASLNLDLLLHNLVAVGGAIVALALISHFVTALFLRSAGFVLGSSFFKEKLGDDEHDAFKRRVRRIELLWMALLVAALLAVGLFATHRGMRLLDMAKAALERQNMDELSSLKTRVLASIGILLGAVVIDVIARAFIGALGRAVARSEWLKARREALTDVVARMRTAARTLLFSAAAIVVADKLALPDGVSGVVHFLAYVLAAFYLSRFAAGLGYLVIDVLFDNSARLAKVESPLKYLGSLKHLSGITKRVVDYCVYLTAATWVADALTPGTWLSHVGPIGLRIIAIFYASRVLVEICVLLVQDIFLGKTSDAPAEVLQQRKTLVPVAVGFVRYGIYFTALVMGLREASIDPTPLLAGAGVIGVAIGFGAQTFVSDIVAGFFILFENLLLAGDLVEIGGIMGRVEEVGVRITKIRDESGILHAIPNGEVRKVANHSRSYVNAVIDVHVPYEEDLPRVLKLITEVTEKELEVLTGAPGKVEINVEELTEASIMLRVLARVPPGESKDMGDVLRGRIVDELCKAKVGAPRPRRAVLIESKIKIGRPPPLEVEESEPMDPFSPAEAE